MQSQPLDPLCQHLSGGACAFFLSSLLLIHTLGRCCGATSNPSLHPATNPDTQNPSQTRFSCFLASSPQREQTIKVKKVKSTAAEVTLRGQTLELCRLRRFPPLAVISSPSDLTTVGGPTKPFSHQPFFFYRQWLQDKEVLLHTWLQTASYMMERVYDRGGQVGGVAQQATLTCPCSENLGEPGPIAPSPTQATWPLQPPLSYYHNFPKRHCGASTTREASVFYRMFCVLLPLSHS